MSKGKRIEVGPNDTLVFDPDKPQLDLPLETLRHIIHNASDCAARMRVNVMMMDAQGRRNRYEQRTALRLSDIMTDSLHQVTELLEGKDLDEHESIGGTGL